ncbi:hypothetical protein [Ectothiorhodospira sp. BSL-9]|uniref:hypothetical protein n=1 Tax=Ectothiorhodospira sp. BSL-9 TaxID=1442136 RepID=UPI0007B42910|nr:hypothetical protein [Ectothiorhodospira sp. BSL-9]ANB01752.1 hypothetical protein ECTOBSL9_0930 [Ectothiorhodospira sp. BSL-9]TVQ75070.1 MAG: hypothetical protein EA372_00810 [Chromatiaceae bacterium]
MSENKKEEKQSGGLPRWARLLMTPLILVVAGALIWSQLPKGAYPTDLSRIGDGRPALVVTYDASYMTGMQVLELMDRIRDEYRDEVEFLVANLGTPDGRDLATRFRVNDGAVVLFRSDGQPVQVLQSPRHEQVLRDAMQEHLGVSPAR